MKRTAGAHFRSGRAPQGKHFACPNPRPGKRAMTRLTAALLSLAVTAASIPPAMAAASETDKPFSVYISPSAQPWNPAADGVGNEEMYMRQIAVAMVPYLQAYGLHYIVAAPQDGPSSQQGDFLRQRIREAEARGCDLYIALHSNASNGSARGAQFYLYGQDQGGNTFTQMLTRNYSYPDPSNIRRFNNSSFLELNTPTMPRALIETAFHDNPQVLAWIKSNIDAIAKDLADTVYQYSISDPIPHRAGLSLNRIFANLNVGQNFLLQVMSIPTGLTYGASAVRWTSSNTQVASVDSSGRVTARSRGTAIIRATVDGYTASCTVSVA